MRAAYLDKLNGRQRAAVEHGVGLADGRAGGPLLIIARAGQGKTNTLAHRVGHLFVKGADPRRILLMTFSPRAASEIRRTLTPRAGGAPRVRRLPQEERSEERPVPAR